MSWEGTRGGHVSALERAPSGSNEAAATRCARCAPGGMHGTAGARAAQGTVSSETKGAPSMGTWYHRVRYLGISWECSARDEETENVRRGHDRSIEMRER